jgi:hypothetical protein
LTDPATKKNDYIDAVALAFTWPKFHRKTDIPYLLLEDNEQMATFLYAVLQGPADAQRR